MLRSLYGYKKKCVCSFAGWLSPYSVVPVSPEPSFHLSYCFMTSAVVGLCLYFSLTNPKRKKSIRVKSREPASISFIGTFCSRCTKELIIISPKKVSNAGFKCSFSVLQKRRIFRETKLHDSSTVIWLWIFKFNLNCMIILMLIVNQYGDLPIASELGKNFLYLDQCV